jgi:hypothetical protein
MAAEVSDCAARPGKRSPPTPMVVKNANPRLRHFAFMSKFSFPRRGFWSNPVKG